MNTINQALWTCIGIIQRDRFIMAPNLPGLVFSFISFTLCLVYPNNNNKKKKKKNSGGQYKKGGTYDDDDDSEEGLLIKGAFSLESLDDYNSNTIV